MNVLEDKQKRDAAYEAHRREQQARMAEVPMWEKLRWLEEMHRLALRLQRQAAGQPEAKP